MFSVCFSVVLVASGTRLIKFDWCLFLIICHAAGGMVCVLQGLLTNKKFV